MGEAERINTWLSGSPYSWPTDIDGEARAQALLAEQYRIAQRADQVRARFAQAAAEIRDELERDLDIRLVYESNAIEGVPTTFAETAEFVAHAEVEGSDYLSAYSLGQQVQAEPKLLEVLGHRGAVQFMRALAADADGPGLREVDVRNLHRMVTASEPRIAGSYKQTDNSIAGRPDLLTARSDDVGAHMRQLLDWLAKCRLNGPLPAAVVHAWMSWVHPFEDGNGRVARLLSNYVLYRNRWPCLIIRAGGDREQYYDALAHSDSGGDITPLFALFVEGLHRTLAEMEHPDFARRILSADIDSQDRFEAWATMLTPFTNRLSAALRLHRLQLDVVGHLDPGDFAWLSRHDSAGNGWYAKVHDETMTRNILLWFGYQSEALRSYGTQLSPTPSIFVSERDLTPSSIHPYRWLRDDPRLAVHEVSLQPRGDRQRAVVRRDGTVTRRTIDQAASDLADAVAGLGSSVA